MCQFVSINEKGLTAFSACKSLILLVPPIRFERTTPGLGILVFYNIFYTIQHIGVYLDVISCFIDNPHNPSNLHR